MNTCKTCSHWERWPQEYRDSDEFGGSCDFLGRDNDVGDNVRVYSDSLPITTEENFGCIHHKEKQ